MKFKKKSLTIILLLFLFLSVFKSLSSFSEEPSTCSQDSPVLAQNDDILFLIDFSSSMDELYGSLSKTEIARNIINDVLRTTENENFVSIRIFGHTNDRDSCSYSDNIYPFQPPSAEISKVMSGYKTGASTPLEKALRDGVNDLSGSYYTQRKHIILITDGEETCGGDPCRFIKKLAAEKSDVIIDVIALTKTSTSQLKCIADSSGGRFFTKVPSFCKTGEIKTAAAINNDADNNSDNSYTGNYNGNFASNPGNWDYVVNSDDIQNSDENNADDSDNNNQTSDNINTYSPPPPKYYQLEKFDSKSELIGYKLYLFEVND